MSGNRHNVTEVAVTVKPESCGYPEQVTQGLQRYYGGRDLHFITCSCYRRQPQLGTARRRSHADG